PTFPRCRRAARSPLAAAAPRTTAARPPRRSPNTNPATAGRAGIPSATRGPGGWLPPGGARGVRGDGLPPGGNSGMTSGKEPLLQVRDLVQEFVVRDYGGVRGGVVHAVSGVSFTVWPGETLGIVGETGSGKSTLARSVLQAPRPRAGTVTFRGADLTTLRGKNLLQARRHLQMVFQDPFSSLDPKWTVRDLVAEPLIAYRVGDRAARRHRVDAVLELVGLDPAAHGDRRPRELSGGQAQRVAIARALAMEPAMIICDEPVSSLDVLIQA